MNWAQVFFLSVYALFITNGCSLNTDLTVVGTGSNNATNLLPTSASLSVNFADEKVVQSNFQNYLVSGVCDPNGSSVSVSGLSFTPVSVACDNGGNWSASLFFSSSADGNETLQVDQIDAQGKQLNSSTTVEIDLECIVFIGQSLIDQAAGGRGLTNANPIRVCSVSQLGEMNNISLPLNRFFVLKNYIDFNESGLRVTRTFDGAFDGYDLKIRNFKLALDFSSLALFVSVSGSGKIHNLHFINARVETLVGVSSHIATVTASLQDSAILDNVSVHGSFCALNDNIVGGIVGEVDQDAKVTNSSVDVHMACATNDVGGIAGLNRGTIEKSSSTGTVAGSDRIGGIVGSSYRAPQPSVVPSLKENTSSASVSGDSHVGGIVGDSDGFLTELNSTGAVTGAQQWVGGIAGRQSYYDISECNYFGNLSGGTSSVGGIAGEIQDTPSGPAGNLRVTMSSFRGVINSPSANSVGGIAGTATSNTPVDPIQFDQVFATGNITGDSNVGGLVGNGPRFEVLNSHYSDGVIAGSNFVGGLVGVGSTSINFSRCYVSPKSVSGSSSDLIMAVGLPLAESFLYYNSSIGSSVIGTPRSNAQMQSLASLPGLLLTVWKMEPSVSAFPVLISFY